jgi:hypothetical protein
LLLPLLHTVKFTIVFCYPFYFSLVSVVCIRRPEILTFFGKSLNVGCYSRSVALITGRLNRNFGGMKFLHKWLFISKWAIETFVSLYLPYISLFLVTFVHTMVYRSGADPGFQVRGSALKKIAPSGGRREHFWGISCEKSRFYAKKSYFFPILGGRPCR